MMANFHSKYSQLDPSSQKIVDDYIDVLFQKQSAVPRDSKSYEENLLKVSVWSDKDLRESEGSTDSFRDWKA